MKASGTNPAPPLYRMRIFAPNHVVAKSRFWYFVSQLRKMKKASGETVYCGLVHEKTPQKVKNFGIWLRLRLSQGTHNMYREYRDLTTSAAVTQCYRDMGARHRARAHSIQIMKDSKIKFPLPHRVLLAPFVHQGVAVVRHMKLNLSRTRYLPPFFQIGQGFQNKSDDRITDQRAEDTFIIEEGSQNTAQITPCLKVIDAAAELRFPHVDCVGVRGQINEAFTCVRALENQSEERTDLQHKTNGLLLLTTTKGEVYDPKLTTTKGEVYDPKLTTTKGEVYDPKLTTTKSEVYDPKLTTTKADDNKGEVYDPKLTTTKSEVYDPKLTTTKGEVYDPKQTTTKGEVYDPKLTTTNSSMQKPIEKTESLRRDN
ncbi:hypothetical protein F7725_022167 [Dissostichus mawsoni]|uniref:Large ribosomal subunit protein eL20 n=1 Tax=Dissostichus mawsoni TaxID=36200 RepID=A0A7J5ZH96_DISMA|nr:hypothetical protein F7725_022167 [Dissostichus mawsoni]